MSSGEDRLAPALEQAPATEMLDEVAQLALTFRTAIRDVLVDWEAFLPSGRTDNRQLRASG